jgi:D-psicose/D-tagatose/L-ribulose 3-epimerase
MRKIGIHLSYWQEEWSDDLLPLIKKAHQAGFEVAEFPLLFPTTLDYPSLRSQLDDLGMSASCGTGLGESNDITHPDPIVRKDGLDHLKACIIGAAQLNSPVLGGLTYAGWGVFPKEGRSERRRQCIESLREVSKMASDHGITVCLEVVNRFEGYLINTVEQALALLSEVGSIHLKLHLDTFHMNIEEDHIGAAILGAGSQLGHLHVVENNRKIPGSGHIPWEDVKHSLNAIGYDGYIIAETFVNPAGSVGNGLYIWRSTADDLDQSAQTAARFLRQEFQNV